MRSLGGLVIQEQASAPATPPAGNAVLYSTDGSSLLIKDEAGTVRTVGSAAGVKVSALAAVTTPADTDVFPVVNSAVSKKMTLDQLHSYLMGRDRVDNASVANQTGFAADTYLTGSDCLIPSGRLQAKSEYRAKFNVVKTGAGTAAPVINVRFGTAGTTADTSRGTLTFAAQTAVIDEGLFEVFCTFRTVGSGTSAVLQSLGTLVHRLSITGLSTDVSGAKLATSAGFDSTVANSKIGLSVNGGTSASWTVSLVQAELFNLA